MSKLRPSPDQMAERIGQPHFGRLQEVMPSTDPIQPTPMVVAVDEIDVYEHNPRQLANDKYEEIKASIHASGMDQTLSITRRPGAARYTVAAGGNTRLKALNELWAETRDERFRSVHCLFRPWQGDTSTLIAHLRENDVRGDLMFIDRARGLMQLKDLVESERSHALSQREFLTYLSEHGYRVSPPVLASVTYTVQSLKMAIPTALRAGLSRTSVDRIRKLHKAFVVAWSTLRIPDAEAGESLFTDLLGRHDDDVINLELLHRDAVNELSVSADCDVQHAAMIYGAAIDGRDLGPLIEQVKIGSTTEIGEASTTAPEQALAGAPSTQPDQAKRPAKQASVANKAAEHSQMRPRPDVHDVADLRLDAYKSAQVAAQMLGCDEMIARIDGGLGFLVGALPAEVRDAVPEAQHPALTCAWWMLVSVSEQFASHGLAANSMPAGWVNTPIGEAMEKAYDIQNRRRLIQHKRDDVLQDVPYMPPSDYAAFGLHRVTQEFFETWTALIATTRGIYEATNGQPWA